MEEGIGGIQLGMFLLVSPFPRFSPPVVGFVLLCCVLFRFLVSEAQTRGKPLQFAALVGYYVDLGSMDYLEAGRRSPYICWLFLCSRDLTLGARDLGLDFPY
ncbi:hypothetical protein CI102_12502 [Trichoderma harzianum]|nr:hypothetical protein CI102_12502 [Trichoderma harzianum]